MVAINEKNICIRQMQISDYDDVYALWLSCRGMGLNTVDDSKEGIEKFLRCNPHTCFVAAQKRENGEEEIIGVILIGTDGRRGYIYHAAVKEVFQRQGVGRSLVKTALDACKAQGITKVALVAFARNEAGNRFWQSVGFTNRTDLTYQDIALKDMERIDT